MLPIAQWDDVERRRAELGELASWQTDLGSAAGSENVGVTRWQIDAGKRSTPAHVELAEEEIFFVLGGSGLSWQDGTTYAVRPGDSIVHRACEEAHTLVAGDQGLDVLAFGMRVYAGGTYLPRAGVVRMPPAWTEAPGGAHPWEREVAAGPLDVPGPTARPRSIVNLEEVDAEESRRGGFETATRYLGRAAGSERTGLRHDVVAAGKQNWPQHCHSAEEELFVVLDGEGVCLLGDDEHPVRRGHVVARPAGTRVAHAFRGGGAPLTLLSYGTREPNDIAYFPRSNKVYFRGVGLMTRAERLDYWDDEA